MRLGCTTGRSPVLLDDSCSSLMANLWESAGFFSSSVSVSVTESQPESKIKYTQSCCNTPLCWKCLSHTSILKNSYEGCGVELAIPPKVMLRKGDLVEERETTEFPLFFFFPLRGFEGEIQKDIKGVEYHWICLHYKQQWHSLLSWTVPSC